jgi:hypothetical protein
MLERAREVGDFRRTPAHGLARKQERAADYTARIYVVNEEVQAVTMAGSKRQMTLVFRRTGQRRYAVEVQRPGLPDLEMNPAPGFDPRMPHDMMHLVVEAQLGLTRGIFGQLASGGTAGTFRLSDDQGSRESARARKRVTARGKKLLRNGRDECEQSERATFICWKEWRARSTKDVRNTTGATISQSKLDEICRHLDHLSARWSSLEIGQSMTVAWPELNIL